MDKRQSRITILVCLAISVVVVLFGFKTRSRPQVNAIVTPSPAPVPEVQASQLTTVGSPDGKMSLTMKQKKGDGTVTYTFLITDETSGSQREIFFKTVPSGTAFTVPNNTFSSDNKYVFFKEISLGSVDYHVLTSSGEPVYKDSQSFNFSSLFSEKYENYVITDATGWAGPTLVVINTDKSGGGTGPSFWFDVASRSFIQLSNRFD
jgi:hypothetical protein